MEKPDTKKDSPPKLTIENKYILEEFDKLKQPGRVYYGCLKYKQRNVIHKERPKVLKQTNKKVII